MKNKIVLQIENGFTLLELLVVIGIIGIMVSLFSVSYSNAQKTSRDSRRRQDLAAIQNAMEQYYGATNFTYPVCAAQACAGLIPFFSGSTPAVPTDPLSSGVYKYTFTSNASSYSVAACLEKDACATPISVTNLQ